MIRPSLWVPANRATDWDQGEKVKGGSSGGRKAPSSRAFSANLITAGFGRWG